MSAAPQSHAGRPLRHAAGPRPHRLHGARHADRGRDGSRGAAAGQCAVRQPSRHGGAGDRRDGSRPPGRGRQRADCAGRPALARPDRSTRRCAQAAGVRSHASFEARPGAEGRHDRGLEHGLPGRCRRLCAAGLHGQPVDLCTRRRRWFPGPQARRRRFPAAGARAGAGRRGQEARPALRLWQRAGPHRVGAAGRPFQRARPAHLHGVRLPGLQGGRSHGHPLRGSDDRACGERRQGRRRHHLRRHRPGRHPGAGRRPADRAAGRPADRGRLPEDRHRGLGRPAAARPPAARPDSTFRPGHCRRGRAAAPRPGDTDPACPLQASSPRGRRAASTSCGSTKRT